MRQLSYTFEDVRFFPQIQFKAASPTKAACSQDRYQGSGAGVGLIDVGGMVSGQVSLRSIAERAYLTNSKANDTGIAQFSSSVSGDDFGGYKCPRNTASAM